MLMAELKMKSKEPMSKEQLQKLCAHERDVMLLHLEDVALAARRYGRPADIEELEIDLENGWAYKLLAMFGIRQHLTLKEGCSGHRYLVANGVPTSHIPAIKSNYIELFDEANSRAFQDGIRMLMDQFGWQAGSRSDSAPSRRRSHVRWRMPPQRHAELSRRGRKSVGWSKPDSF